MNEEFLKYLNDYFHVARTCEHKSIEKEDEKLQSFYRGMQHAASNIKEGYLLLHTPDDPEDHVADVSGAVAYVRQKDLLKML